MPEEIIDITEEDLIQDPPEPAAPAEPPAEPTEPIVDPAKPKQTVQERINEITYKMREEEREKEYWKNLALGEKEPLDPPPPKPSTEGRPSQVNYESVEEYEDALFDWRDAKRNSETLAKTQEEEKKEALSEFNKNAAKLRAEHEDFDEVINAPVFTDPMKDALFASENGPLVAYHIAKNREVADKIKTLSPERQIYEMGKLEERLILAQKTIKTTAAPEPIIPVGTTGAPEIDPSKMNTEDWMEWNKEQEIKKIKSKLEPRAP